jgi:hypothetical protein
VEFLKRETISEKYKVSKNIRESWFADEEKTKGRRSE